MKLSLALVAMLLSTQAIAGNRQNPSPVPAQKDVDTRPAVAFEKGDGRLGLVTITGAEAKKIYDALDVEASFEFGFVQLHTKRLNNVECTQAILGDIPGKMSGPRYTCKIEMYLR